MRKRFLMDFCCIFCSKSPNPRTYESQDNKGVFLQAKSCFRTHSFILQLIYIKKLPIPAIF